MHRTPGPVHSPPHASCTPLHTSASAGVHSYLILPSNHTYHASTDGACVQATDPSGDEDSENEQMLCIICMEQPKTYGFLHGGGDCLHVCACKQCAERWFREHGTCPVCNQAADTIVPVFW